MKIGFIGAGKVGFSLGKYFKEKGVTITGYYSRTASNSVDAADFTQSKNYKNIEDLISESDAIFITTTDVEINNVWNQIKELAIQNKIICHCSGSLSSKIFSEIKSKQAYGYSIHPIFAICDKYNSYKDLKKSFFTIEGSSKYINKIEELINFLGNDYKVISSSEKERYHASTVMVSNLVLALINKGITQLNLCGFNNDEAIKALMPLIRNNINNIEENGIIKSLTGPLERGDINTIMNHRTKLKDEDLVVYDLLSRELLKIAKLKNSNRNYEELEGCIGD